MRIIKPGTKPEQLPKYITCGSCKAELEYTTKDITYGEAISCFSTYVVCPCCTTHITVRT